MRRLLPLALLALSPVLATAQKRPITDKDLFDFTWIGDTQLSPDGKTIAFVQTTVAPDHSGYQTSLYLLDLSAANALPRRLTPGTHDSSPRWSPDGSKLAFLRAAEKDGKPSPPQLYLTTVAPTASPIKLSELPRGASSPQWEPNGAAIAVTSSTPRDPDKAKREAMLKARATGDEAHISDVRIIDQAGFRSNGEGYLDADNVPQVYLVALPKPDGTQDPAWQLTGGRYGVEEFFWQPGTTSLFFTSNHQDETYYNNVQHNAVFAIELPAGAQHGKDFPVVQFTHDFATLEAHGLAMSPDGKHIAFHATVLPPPPAAPVSHHDGDLFVLDLETRQEHFHGARAAPQPHRQQRL